MAHVSRKKIAASLLGISMAVGFAAQSHAIVIATISGQYGSPVGDTPNLFIHNSTAFDFTNVQISGQAYNGSNAGLAAGTDIDKIDNLGGPFHRTQIKNLPNILANTTLTYTFLDGPAACGPGFSNQGNLFATDYDDTYGCSTAAQPGNVKFTFTALWQGDPIFSVFSPDDNFTRGFVGFLGLDQTGNAESIFDAGGAVAGTGELGTLAVIAEGTPPGVPEPSSLLLLGIGLAGFAASRARRQP